MLFLDNNCFLKYGKELNIYWATIASSDISTSIMINTIRDSRIRKLNTDRIAITSAVVIVYILLLQYC